MIAWYVKNSGKQSAVLESPGFRKDAIRFCNQVGVNFTDKKHLLAPFVHESYLLANNGKLSGSFESNEKLAFLGAQEIRKCITEHLYHNFPELTARDIWYGFQTKLFLSVSVVASHF
ncbi:PREDICTED: ribonuclease 3-like [Acropora digitifera]|uniref:ribonuclease 3-like n=1 Tax=Acropora digitifera TaxID=70779 RepID=UPI00077A2A96|nr:PREDICTED: ribonuclease 3-like [Acropora digitifera]